VPNPVTGDSERVVGKPKKGEGFRKPNTELLPNRISERRVLGASRTFDGQRLLLRGDGLNFLVRPTPALHGRQMNGNYAATMDVPVLLSYVDCQLKYDLQNQRKTATSE